MLEGEIRILGTSAGAGIPAEFCQCEICREAMKRQGKDIRTRTSLMIGDRNKIDMPPDTFCQMTTYKIDLAKLQNLLITHNHGDHFNPGYLGIYAYPYTTVLEKDKVLHVYFNESAYESYMNCGVDWNSPGMRPIEITVLKPFFRYETDDMYFTPFIAIHDENQTCYNFYVEVKGGKRILYALDTLRYPEESLEFLKGVKADICIADGTSLFYVAASHMDYNKNISFRNFLMENGIMTENGRYIVSHFSHYGNHGGPGGDLMMLHENLEEIYGKEGIEVAYDGMVLG